MKIIFALPTLLLAALSASSQVSVSHLLTENLPDPISVDSKLPRLSWQLSSPDRNELQTAYEIQVSDRPSGGGSVWNSGKVASDHSLFIDYGGPAPEAGKKYFWRVRVWDNKGRSSEWSKMASWQMGLLTPADWKAQWIQAAGKEEPSQPSPLLRTAFTANNGIASATAYITAHGLYEAQLNGHRVGDAYLTPGWTSYQKRLQYQAYDVTGLIHPGKNAVGAMLGSGWYRGYIGFEQQHNFYGSDLSLLFQLVIRYKNGHTDTVVSDGRWKSSLGEVLHSELYDGEIVDHRKEQKDWSLPDFNDGSWGGVETAASPKDNLIATINQPVTKHETIRGSKLLTTPKGEKVIDFGQNLTGWVTVKIKGRTGDSIRLSHAEVLDKEGNFYTDNLRRAKAQDVFILKGGEEEVFEPRFTFHGFRYIRVEGSTGPVDPADFTAVVLYSDMPKTGEFTCSNTLIDQLQHNIQWGQQGNFLDVPTDCPQRDERLGWTGDAQVFSRTATFNRGVDNFFTKWLKDVAADQRPNGAVPFVIPNVLGDGASAGWADVATIIPWNLYLAYGDKRVLENQYASMKAWVEYMHAQSPNDLWNTGFHFGDWLFYRPFDDNDGRSAVTDKYLIAQCFYANSTQLLINAAGVLGKSEDVDTYTALLKRIKDAFLREYMTPTGRLVSGTQTAYVLALQFDMLPEPLRKQAAERLVKNIQDYNYHLTTGFLGTPYLCHVLSRFKQTDVAYRLLLQDSYPSWLYPVKMGATTIWERWDGIRPDSTFETPGMNSFNHYAYGAIGDWMYRVVAGIDTYEDDPGYHHSRIWPHPGGRLRSAAADLETGYGKLSSHWQLEEDTLHVDIVVPANTTSTVYIPAPEGGLITEGGHNLSTVKDVRIEGIEKGYLMVKLGSGNYRFRVSQ
ncbi:family 78 glycoside hydrolase catalytic domain [Puia sp.]|jgi:alpha-L-rhamnosidase|uniref:family 78 glycoside hydrolase catalytic domain n=1 Tax=Puia sp. TaxID=2045100 RepID=UPI002F402531